MPSPLLDEHSPHFDERSNYLLIVLGLVSLCRKVEQLGADAARRPSIRLASEPAAEADGFLHFVLGVVAVSQRFMQAAHVARKAPGRDNVDNDPVVNPGLPRNLAL